MQTNEPHDDKYDETEPKNMPHDKNINQREKPANSHVVNPVVQSITQTEPSNVDKETIINETIKNTEVTAQSSAFAGLFILAEMATLLLSRRGHVATEQDVVQSTPHSSIQYSPVYEENNKPEPSENTAETNNGNIFGNLLFLAELATALNPIQSVNEPLTPEDNTPGMAPYKDCTVEYEYVMPYIEIVEQEIDTSAVTAQQNDVEFNDVPASVDIVGPQDDISALPQFEYHDVEFEDFSDLVAFVGREEDVPPIQDDDDEEFDQLLNQLIHY